MKKYFLVLLLSLLFAACAKDSGSFVRPVKGILTTSKIHLQYLSCASYASLL